MSYVGNSPALKYTTFAVQHFTTSATTGYTLDTAVNNENDIRLVRNNVVQQPGGSYAYTASGTTLTLSAATTTSDTLYCVFLGKAVQTVNPGAASVGTSQLAALAVTNAKVADDAIGVDELSATGTASSSNYLRGDNSWAAAGGDLSFGGDTFGADKTVGANDAYAFTLETSGNPAIKMDALGHVTKPLQPAFYAILSGGKVDPGTEMVIIILI